MKAEVIGTESRDAVLENQAEWVADKIDKLLTVLDKDVQRIESSLSRLNELRSLIIKRDDISLGQLLGDIRNESSSYRGHELKRQSIREELAVALDCAPKQITLTRLEAMLSGERKARVTEKKTKLKSLAEELKREYLSTVLLLSDCARFNSMLLKNIFDLGKTQTITYSSNGSAKRQTDMAFVNLQF